MAWSREFTNACFSAELICITFLLTGEREGSREDGGKHGGREEKGRETRGRVKGGREEGGK